ncbi:MAG TPA: alpha/beta fold hydrolase [Acidimicrobiales bacterium]|nr:alpha/beta fold hydrolase [Acidimicrobiales bacterium]
MHQGLEITGTSSTELSVAFAGLVPEAAAPVLVLVHGFTQSGAAWHPLCPLLGDHLQLVLPDAPGHGGSAVVEASLWATADLLARTVPRQRNPAAWAGYSMGGRMALHVALAHPRSVARLALISATAGIEDDAEREARKAADLAMAERVLEIGVDEFLAEWLAQPLFASLAATPADVRARRANTASGLASSLRNAGTGSQQSLWPRLAELRERALPVLLIAGELDPKYCDLAERMASAIGSSARLFIVPGAGHACHLERPREVAAALSTFSAPPSPSK